ncbi:DNA polymerase-3 subunit alpha [Ruminococcus sp. YRD2003]|uniref:DNA polymerase III subunit alpha n=1 Tax=Ruminococcus sp. YRD2003 TaxID=1452313 RepID=UPI0008C9E3E2|nr:DNA polymerase-3 subunit alpha [Ruminococcus flavefaciens]
MKSDSFVNLHVHTQYSLLDGACRISRLVERVKELGQTAVAITDHGNMYGAAEFWKTAKNAGIKPIIGCEVYVAPRTRFDREPKLDVRPYHLILLCENNLGYRNLVKLVSAGFIEGFYNRPRVDLELLKKYHEGLICLSACLIGEVPRLLADGQYTAAKAKALEYRDIFGEGNYFIEVQDHGIREEKRLLPQLYRLSAETGIPLAATNDCHYLAREDAELQNVLLCIQTGKLLGEPTGLNFETDEFFVKSADEMAELFRGHEEAVTNTALIAERCNVDMDFDSAIKIPHFEVEGVSDNDAYLRDLSFEGLYKRYGQNVAGSIVKRLEYELSVITEKHFTDYFLIVWDFIRFARENDIPVGPGRGSGAGSLVAYCIGITGIDPVKFDLMFERFLNPERVSMPDFDIDFCIEGRQRVKDYVVQKYGADKVSEIIAFDTLKAKAAVRDIARVLGLPYQVGDRVAKLIDPKGDLSFSLRENPDLALLYRSDSSVKRLIDLALKLEGMPRHTSTHAAGVVISAVRLDDLVPLQRNDNTITTQYTMEYLEALGLLKMDFLGLRNLTIIRDAVREIHRKRPDFDISRIPTDDAAVYAMLSRGDTAGVFQFESSGMTQKLIDLQPERLEDLIVVLSLYRPGPMKSIPVYIENKKNPANIRYIHPLLKDILGDTYGVMVYQEQVMEICRRLAGYSYGHADIVRRAMAKKKHDVMLSERESFVSGARSNGVSAEEANAIFDEMVSFASYAFNKSHAAAYAYLAYQTAYLKCHFRGVYMAALMSSVMGNTGKLAEYISDCKSAGTEVMCPHVNQSMRGFTYACGKMYFGLIAVKNIGGGLADRIISDREANGDFRSLQDFCERIGGRELNRKALENLIKAGAFDGLGLNRRQMLDCYDMLLDMAGSGNRGVIDGQLDLFGSADTESLNVKIPFKPEFERKKLLAMEKEAAGMYLSGDPVSEYEHLALLLRTAKTFDIACGSYKDGDNVRMLCIVQERKLHVTRNGSKMSFLVLSDDMGELEAVVFPDLFAAAGAVLTEGSILFISGRVSQKDDSYSLICESLVPEDGFAGMVGRMRLCIKVRSDESPMDRLAGICAKYRGETEVCFYLTDVKKTVRPKQPLTLEVTADSFAELAEAFSRENIGLIR